MKHPKDGLPIIAFATQKDWEAWLAAEHATSTGLWLKIAKAATGIETVSYSDAVDSALCYGWIDGQKGAHDDRWWVQRFTPRRARSQWSQVNCKRIEMLVKQKRLTPAGKREVDAAKKDGRWDAAYQPQSTATVPPDLQAALDANPAAATFFATTTGSKRYAILYRVGSAKLPATRARRIAQFVEMLAEGKTPLD